MKQITTLFALLLGSVFILFGQKPEFEVGEFFYDLSPLQYYALMGSHKSTNGNYQMTIAKKGFYKENSIKQELINVVYDNNLKMVAEKVIPFSDLFPSQGTSILQGLFYWNFLI